MKPFSKTYHGVNMASGYRHVTPEQRYTISVMRQQGHSQRAIASSIGVSPATVSRELRRNGMQGRYDAERAQQAAQQRQQYRSKPRTFTTEVRCLFECFLTLKWSPEEIAGFCALHGHPHVSPERMYQYVWADKAQGGDLHKHLRRGGKRYRKRGAAHDGRGLIPNRRSIHLRPPIVDQRVRLGDWEADTMIGVGHRKAIVSIVDRVSCYAMLRMVSNKTAQAVSHACSTALSSAIHLVHSLTVDNGKEFAYHKTIEHNINAHVYFADPYCSWQRGTNENYNGLVRQLIPKSRPLSSVSEQELHTIELLLNSRPRKKLGFKSPIEVHFLERANVALPT
jgi:IS30 family transposase